MTADYTDLQLRTVGKASLKDMTPAELDKVLAALKAEGFAPGPGAGKGRDWAKPNGKRNEALDCAVYALAAAHFLGMERWKEADWARWALALVEQPAPRQKTAPQPGNQQPEGAPPALLARPKQPARAARDW